MPIHTKAERAKRIANLKARLRKAAGIKSGKTQSSGGTNANTRKMLNEVARLQRLNR